LEISFDTTAPILSGPNGKARVFVAEGSDKSIVGTIAHVPRRFTSAVTGPVTIMQVVDIYLSERLRMQGVFLGLLDFACNNMQGPRIGKTNESSATIGAGLGWHVLGSYQTWQFPVQILSLDGTDTLSFTRRLLNFLVGIYHLFWLPRVTQSLEMQPVSRFSRDYPVNSTALHGDRSAAYLNWRFFDNPYGNYYACEFLDGSESIGYCVYTLSNSVAFLSDFITLRSRRYCFRLFLDHCRELKATRITYSGIGLHCSSLGFIHRKWDLDLIGIDLPDGSWLVTACDLDEEPVKPPRDIDRETCTPDEK